MRRSAWTSYVLISWKVSDSILRIIRIEIYGEAFFTGSSFFGGDQYDTVYSFRTIKCGCRCTLQDGDVINILRVDIQKAVTS